jgi:hypothetical protein
MKPLDIQTCLAIERKDSDGTVYNTMERGIVSDEGLDPSSTLSSAFDHEGSTCHLYPSPPN